jgi:hypothetical protein
MAYLFIPWSSVFLLIQILVRILRNTQQHGSHYGLYSRSYHSTWVSSIMLRVESMKRPELDLMYYLDISFKISLLA